MWSFLFLVAVVAVLVAADDKTTEVKIPGYDVTPLSKRLFPSKMRNAFSTSALISANPMCREDAATLCKAVSSDNLLLLPCMQSQAEKVSHSCHQLLWAYKVYITTTLNQHVPLFTACSSQFPRLPGCKKADFSNGGMVSCILNNKKNITDKNCRITIFHMQKIVFSDHRLIFGFNQACGHDIYKFKCGRVEKNNSEVFDTGAENQGQVVACLEENIDKISPECKLQIRKKEETAAESIELDTALFKACQLEVSVMCKSLPPGKGNLYRCLFEHMHEPTMKSKCRRQLMRRGKEESRDYKVNFKFTEACNKAIKRYSCDSDGLNAGSFIQTTSILQCLNNHVDKDDDLTDDCKAEMATMVKKLMGNYQLDMKLATACERDVADYCSIEKNSREEGGVISCLMKKEKGKKLSEACSNQVQQLVEAAAPTLTYAVDHITKEKCGDLYNKKCSDAAHKEKFDCLMDHATDSDVSNICRTHLLTLQYFLARDYRMDKRLFSACHEDVDKVCNLQYRSSTVEYPPSHVLHCLYTSYLNEATQDGISQQCITEVKRVMVIRAASINLNPYIDKACMEDLTMFCGDVNTATAGAEFKCLQENFDQLSPNCHDAIGNWTAMESEDLRMDQPLMKSCKPMISKYCKDVRRGTGEIIHCLALNKNDLQFSEECRQQVLDYQITILRKVKFDTAFVKACGDSAHILCGLESTKEEILSCLQSKSGELTMQCRIILRREQLEKSENIKLNPTISAVCESDIQRHCSDITAGAGKVLECLRKHFHQLIPPCAAALEPQQLVANKDARVDYVVMHTCKDEIEKFCSQVDPSSVLSCLIAHKTKFAVNSKCKSVIVTREVMQFLEPSLNAKLWKICGEDFKKQCASRAQYTIIRCLSDADEDQLSEPCGDLITHLQKEKQTDYRFNKELINNCEGNQVFESCVSTNHPGHGSVVECLKSKVDTINDPKCEQAITRMIKVASTNVKIDVVLDQTCAEEISNFCGDFGPGNSKVIFCLVRTLKQNKDKMSPECVAALGKRKGMWKHTKLQKIIDDGVKGIKLGVKRSMQQTANSEPVKLYTSSKNFWLVTCGAGVVILLVVIFSRRCRRATRKYT